MGMDIGRFHFIPHGRRRGAIPSVPAPGNISEKLKEISRGGEILSRGADYFAAALSST